MKIKIKRNLGGGYEVYRLVGTRWKYWLPKPYDCVRGEHLYKYYRSADSAKKAAVREKKMMENEKLVENGVVFEI